jgi:MscS family membrane protein
MTSLIKIGLFLGITLILQAALVIFIRRTFKHHHPTLSNGLAQIARLVVALIGFALILNTLGLSLTSLLTISGIGAAVIAFAGKGLIGNFFGGLMLYINRPFTIGEKISSPDRQIEGIVEEMGWILTTVRDTQGCSIYIPNGLFTDIILINLSRKIG